MSRPDCFYFKASPGAWLENKQGINHCDNCGFNMKHGCFHGPGLVVGVDMGTDPHADRTPVEDRFPPDATDTADPNYMG